MEFALFWRLELFIEDQVSVRLTGLLWYMKVEKLANANHFCLGFVFTVSIYLPTSANKKASGKNCCLDFEIGFGIVWEFVKIILVEYTK